MTVNAPPTELSDVVLPVAGKQYKRGVLTVESALVEKIDVDGKPTLYITNVESSAKADPIEGTDMFHTYRNALKPVKKESEGGKANWYALAAIGVYCIYLAIKSLR